MKIGNKLFKTVKELKYLVANGNKAELQSRRN
jgi:hypothetical protein